MVYASDGLSGSYGPYCSAKPKKICCTPKVRPTPQCQLSGFRVRLAHSDFLSVASCCDFEGTSVGIKLDIVEARSLYLPASNYRLIFRWLPK